MVSGFDFTIPLFNISDIVCLTLTPKERSFKYFTIEIIYHLSNKPQHLEKKQSIYITLFAAQIEQLHL